MKKVKEKFPNDWRVRKTNMGQPSTCYTRKELNMWIIMGYFKTKKREVQMKVRDPGMVRIENTVVYER
jgi:hypothetical protein